MSKQVRSPTLELITRVREVRASKSPTDTYRVALQALEEASRLGSSSQGLLLMLLREIFEEAIFSNEEYSSSSSTTTTATYAKVAHVTLALRSKQQSEWAQSDIERLKQDNLELQEQNGLCRAECEAAREELRSELNRQTKADLKIEHLEEELKNQQAHATMSEEESHASFVSLTNHSEGMRHRLKRSQVVISELASYRDKLESVRVRFRRLTTENNAGELKTKAVPKIQVNKLAEQLRGLYFDLYQKYEITRTNVNHTSEHIHNCRREFSKNAGALIKEKEDLDIHKRNELSTDDEKKLRFVTGDKHVKAMCESLERMKTIRGGLWVCYAELCESYMDDHLADSTMSAVNPPNWPHPMPSKKIVHQDILAIYAKIGPPSSDPITTCSPPEIIRFLGGKYISFSSSVVNYFVEQYDNVRIAISALHAFLKAVTVMRHEGSTRIEMFCRALAGKISIFSVWSYVEAMRSLSTVRKQVLVGSNFDRNQAVHSLYGDFASLAEMVDVENHLTAYVRKFISKEEEEGGFEKKEDEKKSEEDEKVEAEEGEEEEEEEEKREEGSEESEGDEEDEKSRKSRKSNSALNMMSGYDMLMEFLCGQLIGGNELRVRKSMAALSARDLVNSGKMKLTRFQDAVVGMWKKSQTISRIRLTRMFRAIVFETHGEDMWDYIGQKLSMEAAKKNKQFETESEYVDVEEEEEKKKKKKKKKNVETDVSYDPTTSNVKFGIDVSRVKDKDAAKYLMGMEVLIDNDLAQVLAYLTWTMVPTHAKLKHVLDEFADDVKTEEDKILEFKKKEDEKEKSTTAASIGSAGSNVVNIVEAKLAPGETRID